MPTTLIAVIEDGVEDRFFMRRALKTLLPESEILEFGYADEALQYLRSPGRSTPDIVFVDVNLPRMSGFEFADAFATLYDELKQGTKLIMLSHSIDPFDRDRANEHPAVYGFLTKPVTTDDLSALMR